MIRGENERGREKKGDEEGEEEGGGGVRGGRREEEEEEERRWRWRRRRYSKRNHLYIDWVSPINIGTFASGVAGMMRLVSTGVVAGATSRHSQAGMMGAVERESSWGETFSKTLLQTWGGGGGGEEINNFLSLSLSLSLLSLSLSLRHLTLCSSSLISDSPSRANL